MPGLLRAGPKVPSLANTMRACICPHNPCVPCTTLPIPPWCDVEVIRGRVWVAGDGGDWFVSIKWKEKKRLASTLQAECRLKTSISEPSCSCVPTMGAWNKGKGFVAQQSRAWGMNTKGSCLHPRTAWRWKVWRGNVPTRKIKKSIKKAAMVRVQNENKTVWIEDVVCLWFGFPGFLLEEAVETEVFFMQLES